MNQNRQYHNPILRGFYPDPSIVRVHDDFFMVNSTFEYFPAIVISHSKDMVNWRTIGHALTRNDQIDLTGIEDSHGFWAPDISFHDGTFYIFVTLRLNGHVTESAGKTIRRQVVISSKNPGGPYSHPIFIDIDGIDPSHFIDDDGKHYIVLNPGARLVQLNDTCTASVGDPVTIWKGTGLPCPEAPHILKKDGWYYCILAEGGTGYDHQVSAARASKLLGPYEPSPYNPVMVQTDPSGMIQRAGHGKLIETQHGDWWMVYLCSRKNDGNFTTLGRETALDPVQWTNDGWFTVNNGKGPSTKQICPNLPESSVPCFSLDDFDSTTLHSAWQFVRNPDNELWSLAARPGHLRLIAANAPLGSLHAKNILLRREQHFFFTATVKLQFNPSLPGHEAGLVAYHGRHCFIKIFLTFENGLIIKAEENRNDISSLIGSSIPLSKTTVYLQMLVTRQKRECLYSRDNHNWMSLGIVNDATFLSNEGVHIGKHHTGTLIGIYATDGETGERLIADFDWFKYIGTDDKEDLRPSNTAPTRQVIHP
ncbi:MAG: glycoside hydrolase family 43 protein [Spirochaetales bacterium]|nr:glycoside hydrolase family 43 protein [Spirochaetales bacterium]